MKAVEFKNFRNFEEFPMLPINGVTIMVGPNNAGKSTFTKACRMLGKNMSAPLLYNEKNNSEEMFFDFSETCKTFQRAFRKDANDGKMEFVVKSGDFTITYVLAKNEGSQTTTKQAVESMCVFDEIDECSWYVDFAHQCGRLEYSGKLLANILQYSIDHNEKCQLIQDKPYREKYMQMNSISQERMDEKIAQLKNEYENEVSLVEQLSADTSKRTVNFGNNASDLNGRWQIPFDCDMLHFVWKDVQGKEVLDLWYGNADLEGDLLICGSTSYTLIDLNNDYFNQIYKKYQAATRNNVTYIAAHETPEKSSFHVDETHYASRTIWNFFRKNYLALRKGKLDDFLTEMGVATHVEFKLSDNGEVLYINVKDMKGKDVSLADLGRGAIQLVLILMQMLNSVGDSLFEPHPNSDALTVADKDIIIIEEPEQNLHPALQSKLADVFLDFHKCYRKNIIVETHSEYVVRRSQLLVSKMGFENNIESVDKNPFVTYYISENSKPYSLGYRKNGQFMESFGTGFFDEASNLAIDLL